MRYQDGSVMLFSYRGLVVLPGCWNDSLSPGFCDGAGCSCRVSSLDWLLQRTAEESRTVRNTRGEGLNRLVFLSPAWPNPPPHPSGFVSPPPSLLYVLYMFVVLCLLACMHAVLAVLCLLAWCTIYACLRGLLCCAVLGCACGWFNLVLPRRCDTTEKILNDTIHHEI